MRRITGVVWAATVYPSGAIGVPPQQTDQHHVPLQTLDRYEENNGQPFSMHLPTIKIACSGFVFLLQNFNSGHHCAAPVVLQGLMLLTPKL